MEKRGKVFFFIIAGLVVLSELANVVLAVTIRGFEVPIMRSVFVPLLKVWFTWSVWSTGDKQTKWLLAGLMVIGEIVTLSVYIHLLLAMSRVTPSEGSWAFLEIAAGLFAIRVAISLVFLTLGLFLACSPSIQAYLDTRALRRVGWL